MAVAVALYDSTVGYYRLDMHEAGRQDGQCYFMDYYQFLRGHQKKNKEAMKKKGKKLLAEKKKEKA